MRYIGSKSNLLEEIDNLICEKINGCETTFLDLFAGTNVVGEYFKSKYTVYSNDILFFSYVIAKATIENNKKIEFKKLGFNPFDYFQDDNIYLNDNSTTYYQDSYSPIGNAQYFTNENGKRIGIIRDLIDEWYKENKLNENEYYYLIASLVKSIPAISNTTGTYGAFLKHWDKRSLKPLRLKSIPVLDNGRENKAFNCDANLLINEIEADIVYIDTPYNSRQYASNYHVLENIALNNKPPLKGITKIYDWSKKRSDYSMKSKAYEAMKHLIENVKGSHIIVSYSDEGIIGYEDLIDLLEDNSIDNKVEVIKIPYSKYRSKIPSNKKSLYEYLFYIKKRLGVSDMKNNDSIQVEKWSPKTTKYKKSPLNYIGGKFRLLDQIIPFFPDKIDTFLDLFSGGANVGINIDANKHVFNDMNYRVNEMFRFFAKQDTEDLIFKIKERIANNNLSKTNKEAYLKFRKEYNKNPNPLDLYVLISFSYNYQIRFNNSLGFNNPFGNNRSQFSKNMEKNLREFNNHIKTLDYSFTDLYFEDVDYSNLTENDFVYLDPPYLITIGNYNDGNRGFKNWTEKEELKMYEIINNLTESNVPYALSNVIEHKGTENKLLKDFIENNDVFVNTKDITYRNSSYNTQRLDSQEVLITNYDPKLKNKRPI